MRLILSALLCHFLLGSVAMACPGQVGKVILEDDFSDDSGGWQLGPPDQEIKDHVLLLRPNPRGAKEEGPTSISSTNLTFAAASGDFCTEFVLGNPPAADNPVAGGLIFWRTDAKNFFLAQVGSEGKAYIYKLSNNQWSTIYSDANPNSAVKVEPDAVNTIRVVVKDGKITVSVNGTQVKVVRAQQPDNATGFGVRAQSDKISEANPTVQFKSFKVTAGE